jgi:molecular chaperone GrpE
MQHDNESPPEEPRDEQSSPADEPAAGQETSAGDDAGQTVEALRAELEEANDKVLRAYAEAENVRRRAARDVENAHRYALEKFAAELLPVVDSLERAVEAAATAEDGNAIGEGVELALKLFVTTLAKAGIEQVDPLGAPFDPQQQEAMAMVENRDAEPNSVMEVMQKGYLLNGRLVRAARVIVAKAPEAS